MAKNYILVPNKIRETKIGANNMNNGLPNFCFG